MSKFSAKLSKTKNIVRPYLLVKSKLLMRLGSKSGFLTPKARLIFAKFRQIFIKVQILQYFDSKYHI